MQTTMCSGYQISSRNGTHRTKPIPPPSLSGKGTKFTVVYNAYLYQLLALNLLRRFYTKLPESADHIDQRNES